MALTCRRSIVVFACNVSIIALLLLPAPPASPLLFLPSHSCAADQRRHALHHSLVFLRNCGGALKHRVCRPELRVCGRQPGLHPRARACEPVKNARNSAVCSTARCSCTHVKLAYVPPLPASCACPPLTPPCAAGDGQFVAAYDAAQRLHCINAETHHVIALDPVAGTPTALCWHPRESLLAVSLLGANARMRSCICLLLLCGIL